MRILPRVLVTGALVASLAACQQSEEAGDAAEPATPSPSASRSPSPSSSPVAGGTTRAVFFGDSYFVGGGYTEASNSMAQLAADTLGWSATIRGGGGTGFVESNQEYGLADYLGQIDQGALDVDDPDTVQWLVVEGGGNDKDDDPAEIQQRAEAVLTAASAKLPDARIVLVGTLDPTVDDFSDTVAVNTALGQAADTAGVPFIDPQRWLEGRPDLVGPDFDHPTPEGHVLAGQRLADALTTIADQA